MARVALIITLFSTITITSSVTLASDAQHAHTHGVANLTVAFDSGRMEVQLESPALALLGFEHEPKTQQHTKTIETTKALLGKPEKVLSIKGIDCSISSSHLTVIGPVGTPLIEEEGQTNNNDSALLSKQTPKPAPEDTLHDDVHSEISVTYQFDCDAEKTPKTITVLLFEHFPLLNEIDVQWITQTQQGQSTLRSQTSTLEFRQQ